MRALVARVLGRILHAEIAKGFGAWKGAALALAAVAAARAAHAARELGERKRATAMAVVARLRGDAQRAAFASWCAYAARRRSMRRLVARRMFSRTRLARLSGAWRAVAVVPRAPRLSLIHI